MSILNLTIYRRMIKFISRLVGWENKVGSIKFRFDPSKATEALLYLVHRLPVHNVYRVCKLLYLADKVSLEKYGRFLFGETHVAMEGGGTPSNVYALLTKLRVTPTNDLSVDGNTVNAFRDANLDYLSESDIECLDLIISKYANNWRGMMDDSHGIAWKKVWDNRGTKGSKPIQVESIAEMCANSSDLIDYLENSG